MDLGSSSLRVPRKNLSGRLIINFRRVVGFAKSWSVLAQKTTSLSLIKEVMYHRALHRTIIVLRRALLLKCRQRRQRRKPHRSLQDWSLLFSSHPPLLLLVVVPLDGSRVVGPSSWMSAGGSAASLSVVIRGTTRTRNVLLRHLFGALTGAEVRSSCMI